MSARIRILSRPLLGMVVAATLGAACGGGSSPSAPSPTPRPMPTPTPAAEAPSVVDGWTEQPMTADVSPPTVLRNHGCLVQAPGYLTREQVYTGIPVALWPGDEAYVRELVYEGWEFGDGSIRMVRWAEPFTVTLEGELAEDDAARDTTLQVVGELTRRTGLPISIGPGGACRVRVDPSVNDLDAVATASLAFRGTTIVGATVAFLNREELIGRRGAYSNTFLHEMGHVVGLGHSPSRLDVMTPGTGPGSQVREFRLDESVALHMMYVHREPGNLPPDRDPELGAAQVGPPRVTVISGCRTGVPFR